MKPKHQRLLFVAVSMLFLVAAVLLSLRAFRDNLVFFYSPSDLEQQTVAPDRLIRMGGLVEAGSIKRGDNDITFTLTDGAHARRVHFTGLPPNLFREGQGMVAEGYLAASGTFEAKRLLAKHDENYMPREVVDSLKKTGRWKGGE